MRKIDGFSLLNLALVLGSVVFVICLLEIFLRVTGYVPSYADATLYKASGDGRIYEHVPGWSGIFAGTSVRINNYGLRGPDVAEQKIPQEKRILILGDSVTFGYGVPEQISFPAQLEAILQTEKTDQVIRVLNAGVAGYNTRTVNASLKSLWKLRPDIVVLAYLVDNDSDIEPGIRVEPKSGMIIHPGINPSTAGRISLFLHRHSHAYNFIRHRLNLLMSSFNSASNNESSTDAFQDDYAGWTASRSAMIEMRREAKAAGVPFVVGGLALVERLNGIDALSEFCRRQNIPYVELWRTHNPKEYLYNSSISVGDGHPGAAAHRIIAEKLAAEMRTRLKK